MDLERHDPGPEPGIRASDAERDSVVGLLKRHFADGRLTLDEFTERMDVAYAARTRGELVTTLRELPVLIHRPTRPPRHPARRRDHGHRPVVPAPFGLLAVAVLVVLLVASQGMILWPLFFVAWMWNVHNGRLSYHTSHGHRREWNRRDWNRRDWYRDWSR